MKTHRRTQTDFLIETIKCFDVEVSEKSCRFIIEELDAHKAMKITYDEGDFKGCCDHESAMEQIGNKVLEKWPKLSVVLNQWVDEGCSYGSLCGLFVDFLESVAWLAGNRAVPMPSLFYQHPLAIPVKRIPTMDFGFLVDKTIEDRGGNRQWKYDDYFQMAIDGWRVD